MVIYFNGRKFYDRKSPFRAKIQFVLFTEILFDNSIRNCLFLIKLE